MLPRHFVFATWEGGGTVPPALTAARQLMRRGHRVRILSDACNRPEVEAIGATFVPWRRAPSRASKHRDTDVIRDWEAESPEAGFARRVERIMCGPALAYARDVLDELGRAPADAVVANEMLLGAMIAAEAAGVKLAVLGSTISIAPLQGVPPLGLGLTPARSAAERAQHAAHAAALGAAFNRFLPVLNAARRELQLPALSDVLELFARAERVLQATAAAFDFPAEHLPPNLRYVGPLLDEPETTNRWLSPWKRDDARPLVLVGFSTTYQAQRDAIERVAAALAALAVRGVVTLGPALDDLQLTLPGDVMVCGSVRHSDVMRAASAVVTHGGHGTVMRALQHGLPLLCLPMGRDQNDIAARVVARGAGLRLPASASPAEIRVALGRLLVEPSYQTAARTLGRAITAEIACSHLVEELEGLVIPANRRAHTAAASA
jgi:MGT family glycosyltransferase